MWSWSKYKRSDFQFIKVVWPASAAIISWNTGLIIQSIYEFQVKNYERFVEIKIWLDLCCLA